MKKIISLLLILSFLLTALLACGDNQGGSETLGGDNNGAATSTETDKYGQYQLVSAVPVGEINFKKGGEAQLVNVLIRDDEKVVNEWGKDVAADEDGLDEAVITRNEQVEADLGLRLNRIYEASAEATDVKNTFTELISQDLLLGTQKYDVVAHFGCYAISGQLRSYNANLLDKTQFPYFNFKLPCWNQSLVEGSTVNGKSYVCGGDLTLSMFDFAIVFWQNVELYNKYRDPETDPENMAEYVLDGNWVIDDLYNWSLFYADTNPNSAKDTYGLHIQTEKSNGFNDVLPFAMDIPVMTTDKNGRHKWNIANNEKLDNVQQVYSSILTNEGNACREATYGADGSNFAAGNIVFGANVIRFNEAMAQQWRSLDFEYALMPYPKYDADQETYYSCPMVYFTLTTVIDHTKQTNGKIITRGKEVSAFLQYANELSYTDVRGFYFEEVIKSKALGADDNTANSIKIFDMIVDNLRFDFWFLYSEGLNGFLYNLRSLMSDVNLGTFTSLYDRGKTKFEESLEKCDNYFFE